MEILFKILNKIGKKYEELSPQAKATYDRWAEVLDGKPITIEKLKTFLPGEIEATLRELLNSEVRRNTAIDIWLKVRLFDLRMLLSLLESPDKAVKTLEQYLIKLERRLKKVKVK